METKKIGIDCRMIKESGIGRYIENLIFNLNEIDHENEYVLFVLNKETFSLNLGGNFKIIEAPFNWHGIEEQTKFLDLINSYDLELFHSPHPNMPYFYKKDFVITIHDLTMLNERTGRASTYFYPIYFLKWWVFKIMLGRAVRNSRKIITVSKFVKNQICQEFKILPNKVEVIYNGIPELIHIVRDRELIENVKSKFKINKPFLFYVGNAYPHKNLERLILAFKLLNTENKFTLFLGGKEDYFYKRLKNQYGSFTDIVFGGYLSDEEISALYSSCEAFVYPSISEGFGIQIVEALRVGAKLICSNNSSFPEIASKYAYYFNPHDITDIKNVIERSLKSEISYDRKELELHLKQFDWKKSALKHYEIYQQN